MALAYSHRPRGWPLPGWILYVRIAQGVLALLILILTAAAAAKFLHGADTSWLVTPYPGFGFAWFAFAWTLVYLPLATFLVPNLNAKVKPLIILLALELLTTLWWLVTFALLADHSSTLASWLSTAYRDNKTGLGLTQASAVFGAVEFVLFAVVSAFIVLALIRSHRAANAAGTQFVPVQEYPKETVPQAQPQLQPQPTQQPYPQPQGPELAGPHYP